MLLKSKTIQLLLLTIVVIGSSTLQAQPSGLIGKKIQPFSLKNIDQSIISLNSLKETKGCIVIFTCNHCPFAKLYSKRLNELNKKYRRKGVPLMAINSMDSLIYKEESFSFMQKKAIAENYKFYYLQDGTQEVGKLFSAKHTPQAFVIWKEKENWILKYAGAIDDNGENPSKAKSYIASAVDELLAGKSVSKSETASFGCRIFYRKNQ